MANQFMPAVRLTVVFHFFHLVWAHVVLVHCTHAHELMSQAISTPSFQYAIVNGQSFWNFGTVIIPSIMYGPVLSWPFAPVHMN